MAEDLADGRVFFNADEFGDWHIVNGARVLCLHGSPSYKPKTVGRIKGGIHTGSSFIFIRVREFARCPKPNEPIEIDGVRYDITSVEDDCGVYVIEYGRFDDAKLLRRNQ